MSQNEQNDVRVPVTRAVAEGLEMVRSSGLTNMFDRRRVMEILDEMGYVEAYEWVGNNRAKYAELIFKGLQVVEPSADGETN